MLSSKKMVVHAFWYLKGCNDSLAKLNAKVKRMNRKIQIIFPKKEKMIIAMEKGVKPVECFSLGPPLSTCQYCAAVMWKEESTSRSRKSGSSKF
ncbi:unnamed protein product, partial [Linum tenue]